MLPASRFHTRLAPGTPISSGDLSAIGISADLAVHYVRAGWLQRLARGVYCPPNDPPALHPSLIPLREASKDCMSRAVRPRLAASALEWRAGFIAVPGPHARSSRTPDSACRELDATATQAAFLQ